MPAMMTVLTNIFKIDKLLLKRLHQFFLCAHAHVCYGMPVEDRVQPVRASPLLLPHGSWGLNLSHRAWGQAASPTEPSLQPSKLLFRLACFNMKESYHLQCDSQTQWWVESAFEDRAREMASGHPMFRPEMPTSFGILCCHCHGSRLTRDLVPTIYISKQLNTWCLH